MVLVASFPFLSNFITNKVPHSKQDIEKVVEEYILNNPKKIVESVQNIHKAESASQMQEHFQSVFSANENSILNLDYPHIKGKDKNSITIVEFFDYGCGYCKHMKEMISDFMKTRNATLIFRDFPILGPASMLASKFALALNMVDKEKYLDFHLALLSASEEYTNDFLMLTLKKVLDDDSKVKQVMHVLESDSDKIDNLINGTYELTNKIGIRGTPAFIVGKHLHVGFLSQKDLDMYIKDFDKVK